MENSTIPAALSLEKRLVFWKAAMIRLARVSRTVDAEIQALLDVIDGGMVGEDLLSEHGASLITHMLANWPVLEKDPYVFSTGQADLLNYQPGMEWEDAGPHAPAERVVASLIHAGSNPWKFKMQESEDGTLIIPPGETYPPIFFALLTHDTPRASVKALFNHPDCPPIKQLMRYRNETGQGLMELAAMRDGFALRELLTLGADPNTLGSKDLPVIFHARYKDVVQALVGAGAKHDLVDDAGNSLQMHWALKDARSSSDLIGVLPKVVGKADPYKVSLAGLIASLDNQPKTQVKNLLSALKSPASYKWHRNGQELDLLEIMVSEIAFGPVAPKVNTILDLMNKKNQWSELSLHQLFLMKELFSTKSSFSTVEGTKPLLAALDKIAPQLTDVQSQKAIQRLLAVRKAIRPTSPMDNLEHKVKQEILFPWSNWLERVAQKDPTSELLLPVFQGFSHTAIEAKKVGTLFTDNLFSHMVEFVKVHDLPEKDWLFWTAMGIHSRSLVSKEGWDAWEGSLVNHSKEWFKDPLIVSLLALRQDTDLSSRLDQIILGHTTQEVHVSRGQSMRF